MVDPIRVLHVDDEPGLAETVALHLQREHDAVTVRTETTVADALDALDEDAVDCVVSDYDMPRVDGLDFLDRVREDHPDLPFILFTGQGSEDIAAEAVSRGVTDYFQKTVSGDQYAVLADRIVDAVSQYRTGQVVTDADAEPG
jgi:DNA-binding NtrC family response regulator